MTVLALEWIVRVTMDFSDKPWIDMPTLDMCGAINVLLHYSLKLSHCIEKQAATHTHISSYTHTHTHSHSHSHTSHSHLYLCSTSSHPVPVLSQPLLQWQMWPCGVVVQTRLHPPQRACTKQDAVGWGGRCKLHTCNFTGCHCTERRGKLWLFTDFKNTVFVNLIWELCTVSCILNCSH